MDTKLEVLRGKLHETNIRIDQIENDVTKYAKEIDDTYDRLLSLERYSSDYNLRFYNIPESTGEDCIAKLRGILENDLQLQPNIENAHRIGPFKDDGTPGAILAKFLYRPERFRVIKKKRELRDGVRVSDDLIWEDRQKKKELRLVMEEDAFEAGKRPIDFIMASFISTARFIKLEMFEQYILLYMCKSRLKCLLSFIIYTYL